MYRFSLQKTILFLLLFSNANSGYAQDRGKLYYNENWEATGRDSAYYYRDWVKNGDLFEIHDTYKNGEPLLNGFLSKMDENFWACREGHFVYFDRKTGKTICEGDFSKGRKNSAWKYYNIEADLLDEKVVYAGDLITWEIRYYKDGKTASSATEYQLGKVVRQKAYYETGTLKEETEYDGKEVLLERCFGTNGKDTACGKKEEEKQHVEQMPSPTFALNEYLGNNIHYPEAARKRGITGRVIVQFVVLEDGSISNVMVRQAVSPALDEEAMRVVADMPKWKPGIQDGKAVKVMYSQPITFTLD